MLIPGALLLCSLLAGCSIAVGSTNSPPPLGGCPTQPANAVCQ
jgi:hypothetical protein